MNVEALRRTLEALRRGPLATRNRNIALPPSTADLLSFAQELADAADAIALRHFRSLDAAARRKPDGSFVTVADTAVESLLRQAIGERFPNHAILGEEEGEQSGEGAPARWILDPIDGTHNYMRGIPIWATLIACERDGAIEIGVVSAPALGTRWWAARGAGAYRAPIEGGRAGDGGRIHVLDIDTIAEAQVICGELIRTLAHWPGAEALLRDCWRERALGDFWGFCLVAEGAADVMIEGVDLHPWDIAALLPILEEAGGRMTDVAGHATIEAGPRIATNSRLHEEVLRRLRG